MNIEIVYNFYNLFQILYQKIILDLRIWRRFEKPSNKSHMSHVISIILVFVFAENQPRKIKKIDSLDVR